MITVYGMSMSGNCYKLRLLLEQLGRDYRWIEVDSARGETRTPAFLARNPNGRVPLIELEDGRVLVESNAILCWLAEGTGFVPADAWQRAQALSWMFFEQYSHEPYVATPRFIMKHLPADAPRRAELPDRLERGRAALAVMERHLADHRYFAGGRFSVADIALYAYTHVAHEGGHDLAPYPQLRAWLDRVAGQPGHRPLGERPRAATSGCAAPAG